MSAPTTTRQWVLNKQITGEPVIDGPDATFSIKTVDLPALKDGQVLLRTKFLSNDPAQRGWISPIESPDRLYVPPVKAGETMRAGVIAEVIESKADSLPKGTLVQAYTGWTEYAVQDATGLQPLQNIPGVSPTHFLGALGLTGLTAYYGTKIIAEAKPDDVVIVSGAAGATGSMVVQIAKKLIGCKTVIGIAGGDAKCQWVKSLGADICLNYKSPTFKQDLIDATPKYANVYFDNVGGEILDLVLSRMALEGRVAICGAISGYNGTSGQLLKNWFDVISMRLQLKGFIVLDWVKQGKAKESIAEIATAAKEGKIKITDEGETVVSTSFDEIPKTWVKLFEGSNTGKLVTKL
ncbi:Alcohol dehydrogenase superfamily zinc-containing [Botryosphaeria dothidea]|uniref:Alcohol dehydrogenase superfamily zinc-containing n=1 Tax=Botryosphaeria dothidea TaxID=55169 RepID=A0A8H4IJ13_9PEZI|nr:Alcohol dehydrogenase superfamily zinc-containing [Botryosphaeria dothidea]KAF4305119.1 Alcohol dehydrogenase superfamily zinc-containing [Botryosphaeria dothidea]